MDEQTNRYSPVTREFAGTAALRTLIEGCRRNDALCQKVLFTTYHPAAYSIIRRYIASRDIAQELLNDVFFTVLTKIAQYSFQGSFEGWIRQITINTVGLYFRKNRKHNAVVSFDTVSADHSIASGAIAGISFKELLHYIHELPDTQRAVFNLFVFEGCSHREIGRLLDIKENNSRWYLNDARSKLKEKIKKYR